MALMETLQRFQKRYGWRAPEPRALKKGELGSMYLTESFRAAI